jgi:hypothetical protein
MECVTMLKVLWEKWLKFGELLGTPMGNGILTVFYFTLFAIPGICFSLFFDKIGKRFHHDSYFSEDMRDIRLNSVDEALDG